MLQIKVKYARLWYVAAYFTLKFLRSTSITIGATYIMFMNFNANTEHNY